MITKDNAALFVPLIAALAAGKTLEIDMGDNGTPRWTEVKVPLSFSSKPEHYRIKAEPRKLWAVFNCRGERWGSYDTEVKATLALNERQRNGGFVPYSIVSFTEDMQ